MWMLPHRRPELLGYLDRCEDGRVSGWVRDRLRPGKRLTVDVFAEGRLLGSARADAFRQDLRGGRRTSSSVGQAAVAPDCRAYRFRTWLRPGFVEELWTPDAAP